MLLALIRVGGCTTCVDIRTVVAFTQADDQTTTLVLSRLGRRTLGKISLMLSFMCEMLIRLKEGRTTLVKL